MITYLAVGKTGLGKSTYANLLCGAEAPVSSSSASKTRKITSYTSKCEKYRYIDTIGLQDSRGKDSEESDSEESDSEERDSEESDSEERDSEESDTEESDSEEKKEKLDDALIFEKI